MNIRICESKKDSEILNNEFVLSDLLQLIILASSC